MFSIEKAVAESTIKSVKMEQKEVFLTQNTQLVCVVDRGEKQFNGDFQWYLDESPLEMDSMFGWRALLNNKTVIYEYEVEKGPGNYTCVVTDEGQHWNATTRVVAFEGITDFKMVDVTERKIELSCPKGPARTSAFMTVNSGEPADKRFESTAADSFSLNGPAFIDAEKNYTCKYVFTEDIGNNGDIEAIPNDRIISAQLPVMFYRAIKENTNYSLTMQPSRSDIWVQICWALNASMTSSCDNATSVILDTSDVHVNFSVYKGPTLLMTGAFKDSRDEENPESDSTVGIFVGVILGILVVAGVLIFLIIVRWKRKLCFMEAAVSKEDQARMKPLVPKDEEKKEAPDEKQPALEELEAKDDRNDVGSA